MTQGSGELILTTGGEGTLARQLIDLAESLAGRGAPMSDVCQLRVFFKSGAVDEGAILAGLANALPAQTNPVVTLVPVSQPGLSGSNIAMQAAAVTGPPGPTARVIGARGGGNGFATGIRKGRFLFLGGQRPSAVSDTVTESREVMVGLSATLAELGAGFSDIVRINRWYFAAGTAAGWEPAARAAAAYFPEPGPIATGISLPCALAGGYSIQIELMGMIGIDGAQLTKRHSWPEGHWDWPVHLPYKHGLACDGLAFVGGQVSLDSRARVLDPGDWERQTSTCLANIDRVLHGFGDGPHRLLSLGAYLATPAPGDALAHAGITRSLASLATRNCPFTVAGLPNLAYPNMHIEIEAVAELSG